MDAKLTVSNVFVRERDDNEDSGYAYKTMNLYDVKPIYFAKYPEGDSQIFYFPIITKLIGTDFEGKYAIDLGGCARIICDIDYLKALHNAFMGVVVENAAEYKK